VINNLYSNLGFSFNARRFNNTGLDAACDESEPISDPTIFTYIISNGGVNPSNADKGTWTTVFQMVRSANIFLKNRDSIPVTTATRDFWTGQVRFLRAWYLFNLLKHYGGIPLIGDRIFENGEKIDEGRSSYEKCVDYIVGELDAAAALLPASFPVNNVNQNRITKGTALATKARLLLYAASPLFNSGARTDDPDNLLAYASADMERWKKASDAAKAVINLNVYGLHCYCKIHRRMNM
jgi:hypothetical protein